MRLKHFIILVVGFSAAQIVFAVPPVTISQNPTAPIIPDRPSATRPEPPKFKPKKAQPGLTVPDTPAKKSVAEDASTRIFAKGFRFNGHTVFSDAELEAIAEPYTERELSIAELEQLRYLLTQHYVEHGYLSSGAVLPSQSFNDGIIEFKIIEGTLNEIRISGTEHLNPDYVKDRLMLGAGPPLNSAELQERFSLLLQDPLIERMEGRLAPGLTAGQSLLDLSVTRAQPYQLSLSTDNHRPPSTGAVQGRLDGLVRNLTGFGDTLDISLGYSEGSFTYGGGFSIPINRYDTRLSFRAYASQSSIVEEPLEDINIESKLRGFEFAIEQPVYRSLERSFSVGARIAVRKNRSTLEGDSFSFEQGDEDGTSKVSTLRFYQDYSERDPQQVFAARSTFNVGIKAFDATWNNDGTADGDFFSWLGQVQYARLVMDNGAQIQFRGDVQLSNDGLLALEQFALGGANSIRGYRENELVRDQGFALSLEFRYPLLSGTDFPGSLTVIPFMDYGGSWDVSKSKDIEYLHSVGLGFVWTPINQVTAELFYAHDLNTARSKPEYDLQDDGVHFRLSYQIL
ncbi:MAG: ShlB/FhaC/HecB family hemolysin secretion/activation protein [Methylococcales bacterium]